MTNLDLSLLSRLPSKGKPGRSPEGQVWVKEFREQIARALIGSPAGATCEGLDDMIRQANPRGDGLPLKVARVQGDDEDVDAGIVAKEVKPDELEAWRQHVLRGHLPYRRDCQRCIEGSGLGIQHRRVKYKTLFSLSVDLFGPLSKDEKGLDEESVSANPHIKYGLVGAFRVPKKAFQENGKDCDDRPKNGEPEGDDPLKDVDFDGYEPSLEGEDDFLQQYDIGVDEVQESSLQQPSVSVGTVDPGVKAAEDASGRAFSEDECNLWRDEDLPKSKEELEAYIEYLATPPDQVVLRYFVGLKSKTGAEVAAGLQRMIMQVNKLFPVRVLHTDPGTEFTSDALKKWLLQNNISLQHPLPADKQANGLAERTIGGSNELMPKWIKARYLAPHLSVPEGTMFIHPRTEGESLKEGLAPQSKEREAEWSALMVMQATEIGVHKDVRNEWYSKNYVLCVPGALELHLEESPGNPKEGFSNREPLVRPLLDKVVEFDARKPHSVSRSPDWFIVGYSPLGTAKLQENVHNLLYDLGFRYKRQDGILHKVNMIRKEEDDQSLPTEEFVRDPRGDIFLEQDEQPDSHTPIIGWDPTGGNQGNVPVENLEETDLYQFLVEREVPWLYRRLREVGVEEAADLPFLFEEDFIELGIPRGDAQKVGWLDQEEQRIYGEGCPGFASASSNQATKGTAFAVSRGSYPTMQNIDEEYAQHAIYMQELWDQESEDDAETRDSKEKHEDVSVKQVDEAFYTPDVEKLLLSLSGPLRVVHNVSPSEVKQHLASWTSAAEAEVSALEGMHAIKRYTGEEAKVVELTGIGENVGWLAVAILRPKIPQLIYTQAEWVGPGGKTGFKQSSVEPNLWFIVGESSEILGYAIIYVDDIMILSDQPNARAAHDWINTKWKSTPLERATDATAITFLGVDVHVDYDSSGNQGFALSQSGYIDELLRTYQMQPSPRQIPFPREWTKELPEQEVYEIDVLRKAQKITGELLWLSQRSRVDIAYHVALMGSWNVRAPTLVLKLGLRMLEYLWTTRDWRLSLISRPESEKRIEVFTDASFSPYGSHSADAAEEDDEVHVNQGTDGIVEAAPPMPRFTGRYPLLVNAVNAEFDQALK
ncbi:TY5A, partial [Symbiodinium microadriaticum]